MDPTFFPVIACAAHKPETSRRQGKNDQNQEFT
jgi:hypothetical protein